MATRTVTASFYGSDGRERNFVISNVTAEVSIDQANMLLDGLAGASMFGFADVMYYQTPKDVIITTTDTQTVVSR